MRMMLAGTGRRGSLFTAAGRLGLALGLLVFLGATGCQTPPRASDPSSELAEAPDWVTSGCPGSTNRICGVGSASGMQNASLRRTAAIGRARTEIARSLQLRVTAMLKDYAATTTGEGDFGLASADDQHLVDVSKQITNVTLAGTEVMDTWVSQGATFFALVTLDVEKFSATVNEMNQLSEDVRRAVVERAEENFASPTEQWSDG